MRTEIVAEPVTDTGSESENDDNKKKLGSHIEILFIMGKQIIFQCVYASFDVSRAGGTHVIIIIQFGETMNLQAAGKGDKDVCQMIERIGKKSHNKKADNFQKENIPAPIGDLIFFLPILKPGGEKKTKTVNYDRD